MCVCVSVCRGSRIKEKYSHQTEQCWRGRPDRRRRETEAETLSIQTLCGLLLPPRLHHGCWQALLSEIGREGEGETERDKEREIKTDA